MDDSDLDPDAIHVVAADKSYDDLDLGNTGLYPATKGHTSKVKARHSSSEDPTPRQQRSRHSRERKKRSGASSGKTPNLQEFEAMLMREGYLDSSQEVANFSADGMTLEEWQRRLAGTPGGGQYFMDLAGNIKRVCMIFFFKSGL